MLKERRYERNEGINNNYCVFGLLFMGYLFAAEFAACLTTVGIDIDLNCNAGLTAIVTNENNGVLFTPEATDGIGSDRERAGVVGVAGTCVLGVITALLSATVGIERKERERERERESRLTATAVVVECECFIVVGICVWRRKS